MILKYSNTQEIKELISEKNITKVTYGEYFPLCSNTPTMLIIYSPEALEINISHALILMKRLKQAFPKFYL